MNEEELIKILEDYEIFVDDDYGGSYQSIIYYDKEKKISKAHTTISALKIIEIFNKLQQENKQLKEQVEEYKKKLMIITKMEIKKIDENTFVGIDYFQEKCDSLLEKLKQKENIINKANEILAKEYKENLSEHYEYNLYKAINTLNKLSKILDNKGE